jgi:hypothetical protein
MAGKVRSRGTRGTARSSRVAPSWPVLAGASEDVSGSTTGTLPPMWASSTEPALRALPTRPTYQMLLMRGLAPEEAANLTAFLSGIHVGEQSWKLKEINQLLFLRNLNRAGRFGPDDGKSPVH